MDPNKRDAAAKIAERRANRAWRFRGGPPILTPISDNVGQKIIEGLNGYTSTLPRERKVLLHKYHVVDMAHSAVRVGSVEVRACGQAVGIGRPNAS